MHIELLAVDVDGDAVGDIAEMPYAPVIHFDEQIVSDDVLDDAALHLYGGGRCAALDSLRTLYLRKCRYRGADADCSSDQKTSKNRPRSFGFSHTFISPFIFLPAVETEALVRQTGIFGLSRNHITLRRGSDVVEREAGHQRQRCRGRRLQNRDVIRSDDSDLLHDVFFRSVM